MTYHSPRGASKAHRWARCPASVNATKDCEDVATQAALDGSRAHSRAAQEAGARFGDEPVLGFDPVDPEWLPHIQAYVEYCEQFVDDSTIVYVEHEVPIESITEIPGDRGSVDFGALSAKALHVVDFKFGIGDLVASEDAHDEDLILNPQTAMYANGMIEDLEFLLPADPEFPVVMHIFQPRRDHISKVDTNVRAIREYALLLRERSRATLDPNAPFVPGEKQCRWCPIRGSCAARRDWVLSAFNVETKPATMSDSDFEEIAKRINAFTRWRSDVLAEIGKRTQNGAKLGFKFIRGQSRRHFTEKAEEVLEGLLGDKAWTKPDPELIGIGAAEALLGKKHSIFKDVTVVVKPEGPLKLVPVSHNGAEVSADKTDAFTIETE